LTYRAHCLGVRLRRALRKRPRYPLINGEYYSYSSLEIKFNGQTFKHVDHIAFWEKPKRAPKLEPIAFTWKLDPDVAKDL
jgi:hypothetical protein